MNFFRLKVGTKLVGMITVLLICSIASLVWLATRLFITDNTALIQQTNADTATALAARMRDQFLGLNENVRILGTTLLKEHSLNNPDTYNNPIIREYLREDGPILSIFIHQKTDKGISIKHSAQSPAMSALHDPEAQQALEKITTHERNPLESAFQGEPQVFSILLSDGHSALAISVPFIQVAEGFSHTLTSLVRANHFTEPFSESDTITSFMVDRNGYLMAHPNVSRVVAQEDLSHLEIVQQLLEGRFNNGQTRYIDPHRKEAMLGAFRSVGFGGLGVVAEVPEKKALEAAQRVEYRSFLVAIIVLSLAMLFGSIFSGTLTRRIRELVQTADRIAAGEFDIKLLPKSKDEIAELAHAFNSMAQGLEERERVKETFNKFHNKEIADLLLSGKVKLGGERKEAVIFFSDVRGFTATSESMPPEEVVEMLNEYMTKMVRIIRSQNGVVDKYIGDAIMATWGVPMPHEDDVYHSVWACLQMRQALNELNELRISRNQDPIKIGMGINVGQVIAGNIGSDEKMEYTVIGDAVNLASRMESMTKEYGTDLLIPRSIYEKVKDRFVFEECGSMKVKGKSEPIEIFKVQGYVNANGEEVIMKTPYSAFAAEKSDKSAQPAPSSTIPTPPPFRHHTPPPFRHHTPPPFRHHTPPPFRHHLFKTTPPPFSQERAHRELEEMLEMQLENLSPAEQNATRLAA
jgi:adenylate cyclase